MINLLKLCSQYILISMFTGVLIFVPAHAKIIEVRSENFVFVGDVKQKEARALVTELEQYRSAVLTLFRINPIREPMPVRIYGVRSAKEVAAITGLEGVDGAYITRIEGPVFVLNAKAGFRRGNQARKIALHEYTHHLLAAYIDDIYPLWYNEGLANYLSTFEVNKSGQWEIGRPHKPYGYALGAKKWVPMSTVTNSILKYPFATFTRETGQRISSANAFYAQTWLAVHYIQSTNGETQNMRTYLGLVNSGVKAAPAFVQAFGRTPEKFEAQLKAYFKRNQYSVLKLSPKYDIQVKPLNVRELPDGMWAFYKAEAMRRFFGTKVKPQNVLEMYGKAEVHLGETVETLTGRSNIYSLQKQFDKALETVRRAQAFAPENAFVNRTLGLIYYYKNTQKGEKPNPEGIKQAREYLRRAMRIDSDDVSTHYHYVKTFYVLGEMPSAQAKASAEICLDYYKDVSFVSRNLTPASVLIKGGKYKPAKKAADKALVWASRSAVHKRAQRMVNFINKKSIDKNTGP